MNCSTPLNGIGVCADNLASTDLPCTLLINSFTTSGLKSVPVFIALSAIISILLVIHEASASFAFLCYHR